MEEDVEKSAALTDGYPSDLFPIYKDSYIVSAVELEGSYTITAYSKAAFREVAAFYKELLKNATGTSETDSNSGVTSFGTIKTILTALTQGQAAKLKTMLSCQ